MSNTQDAPEIETARLLAREDMRGQRNILRAATGREARAYADELVATAHALKTEVEKEDRALSVLRRVLAVGTFDAQPEVQELLSLAMEELVVSDESRRLAGD